MPQGSFVYLIHDTNIFKIGRCGDINSRKKTYRTHNPTHSWITQIEVSNAQRVESLLLEYLRNHFKKYKDTREWFHGVLTQEQFTQLVEGIEFSNFHRQESLSVDSFVMQSLKKHLEGFPLGFFLYTYHYSDNLDWKDYIELDTEESESCLKVSSSNFRSSLLILLFCEKVLLKDFVLSYVNIEKDWNFRGLHMKDLLSSTTIELYENN